MNISRSFHIFPANVLFTWVNCGNGPLDATGRHWPAPGLPMADDISTGVRWWKIRGRSGFLEVSHFFRWNFMKHLRSVVVYLVYFVALRISWISGDWDENNGKRIFCWSRFWMCCHVGLPDPVIRMIRKRTARHRRTLRYLGLFEHLSIPPHWLILIFLHVWKRYPPNPLVM